MLPYQIEAEAAIGADLYRYLVGRAVEVKTDHQRLVFSLKLRSVLKLA